MTRLDDGGLHSGDLHAAAHSSENALKRTYPVTARPTAENAPSQMHPGISPRNRLRAAFASVTDARWRQPRTSRKTRPEEIPVTGRQPHTAEARWGGRFRKQSTSHGAVSPPGGLCSGRAEAVGRPSRRTAPSMTEQPSRRSSLGCSFRTDAVSKPWRAAMPARPSKRVSARTSRSTCSSPLPRTRPAHESSPMSTREEPANGDQHSSASRLCRRPCPASWARTLTITPCGFPSALR